MCLWGKTMGIMRSSGWELLLLLVIEKPRPTWPAWDAAGLACSGPEHHPHARHIAEASLSCPEEAPGAASVLGIPHSLLECPLCARLCAGH